MATYKLLQDIEAEDHVLGPLTLRQFIFALIAVFLFYINFLVVTKGAVFMLVVFLPPALFFGFFALPFGRDQPTEIWALAKLRFLFKPRKRIWNQDGIKELVTITVPKKVEPILTDGLSQKEVKSRLQALASTLDSRGWAVKNVHPEDFAFHPVAVGAGSSDRLIDISDVPHEVPNYDVVPSDDILDKNSSPVAQQFEDMIEQSSQTHRQQLIDQLNGPPPQPGQSQINDTSVSAQTGNQRVDEPRPDYWFMNAPAASGPTTVEPPAAADLPDSEEAVLAAELKARAASHPEPYGNLRTLRPLDDQPATAPRPAMPAPQAQAVTATPDPAILSLADNDDLNVATLAREARKAKGDGDDEVVIPLH